MKNIGRIWFGITENFGGRLGKSVRDGLLAIGISILMASIIGWTTSDAPLNAMAAQLGLDAEEHGWVLRQVMIGALSNGATEFGTLVALASLMLRTSFAIGRQLRTGQTLWPRQDSSEVSSNLGTPNVRESRKAPGENNRHG